MADEDHPRAAEGEIPGGASIAAQAGTLAAALGAGICRQTIATTNIADVSNEAGDILTELERIGETLRAAAGEETESEEQFRAALNQTAETEAEQLASNSAIEQSARATAGGAARTAEISLQTLELLGELSAICPAQSGGDLAAAAQLALTTMRGASYSLLGRLKFTGDAIYTHQRRREIEEALIRGQEIADILEDKFLSQNL
ncbi:MAG: cyclodeaminase/cyclohydrolase family protein [Blastocatellia bacterium]